MMWSNCLLAAGTAMFLGIASTSFSAELKPGNRPNVLLIMGDDIGYSDIGCYGGEAQTPNLDSLAKNGVRFTQFYNGARCCPTRASLLTGLYAHQTGVGHMTHNDRKLPGYRADLNDKCVTIAEVLGDSGYRTYMSGKWHITRHEKPEGPKHNWPLQRGFEKFYGLIWGSTSFFDPAICRGNTWYSRESDPEYKPETYYLTDALTDNAITFLQQHEKESPEKPFFLYAAYTAAHWPMHALEKDIAKYKGRFDDGYDKLRTQRVERLRKLGLMRPEWEVTPTAENWDQVKNREWELRCMEVYAAMIDSMDQGIGRIIAELKRQNQFENTLILYLQDNGACAEDVGRQANKPRGNIQPLRPEDLPVGGRQPNQTRDGKPVLRGTDVMPGGPDSYIAYGQAWANVSNTPFREYKHWVHEGGIATPLIAHWPKGMPKERANQRVNDPSHLIDIMATVVDVTGTSYPAQRKGRDITPMQGVSLRAALEGKTLERQEPIFWEHEGNRAIRDGKWKLVAKENQPWELFDMDKDRTEMHNLAAQEPERVKTMAAKWDAWAERANVAPLGGYKHEPAAAKGEPSAGVLHLKQGQVIPDGEAPQVHDRALTITVEIQKPGGDGVLVAQGGKAHGYAFFVKDGRIGFSSRRDSKLATVQASKPLTDSATTLTAILQRSGTVELYAGEESIATGSNLWPLLQTPRDGVSGGHDSDDPVGEYADTFPYKGKIGEIAIEVGSN